MVPDHKFSLSFSMFFLFVTLVSCGGYGGSGSSQEEQAQDQNGTFVATLSPINSLVSGTASFTVNQNHFFASVQLEGLTPEADIRQYVVAGNTCPGTAATLAEALAVTGGILIPLDNDLSGQIVGGVYPTANIQGDVSYSNEVNLEDLVDDLRDPDPDTNDNLVKLNPDQLLSMETRSVLITEIQGTEEVPVACGPLNRQT